MSDNVAAYAGGGSSYGTLVRCTLSRNKAVWWSGGGATGGSLSNCVLWGNSSTNGGGGDYCTMASCLLYSNTARYGGGAYECELRNCTLVGNAAENGGGSLATYKTLRNCVVFSNTAAQGPNYSPPDAALDNCCAFPLPMGGQGNIAEDPRFLGGGDYHLAAGSPCVNAGDNSAVAGASDCDGGSRIVGARVDMGAFEYAYAGTGAVLVVSPSRLDFGAIATGEVRDARFLVGNWGVTALIGSAGPAVPPFSLPEGGGFIVSPSAASGVTVRFAPETVGVHSGLVVFACDSGTWTGEVTGVGLAVVVPRLWHVATNGDDGAAGTNWATAKQTIQAAVDAAASNDIVLVSNGVYATGGRMDAWGLTNRLVLTNAITVRSMNGPSVTTIMGAEDPEYVTGEAAIRCVYLEEGCELDGFTLADGHTGRGGDTDTGGGVCCTSVFSIVSNCVIIGCSASQEGGAAYRGTLVNCLLSQNAAFSGGGAYESRLITCMVCSNVAEWGAGAYLGTLRNCAVVRNRAGAIGGGAINAALLNCTVVGNLASNGIGGVSGGSIENCIVYHNTAPINPNHLDLSTARYSDLKPLASGVGNIEEDPRLVSLSNPRLLRGSACIDAATNQPWMAGATDLDGEPRLNGSVDLGADEYHASSATGAMSVAIGCTWTNVAAGFPVPLEAVIEGMPVGYTWFFGDGGRAEDQCLVRHAYTETGVYTVVLSASNLSGQVAATLEVRVGAETIFVAPSGADTNDGSSWALAKETIQAGVDATTLPGALVLVSNGNYATGGRAASGPFHTTSQGGSQTNRVMIDRPVCVRSVQGPDVTVIVGENPGDDAGVRGVYLGVDATLVGFSVTGGFATAAGGIWCESESSVVSNCVVSGNAAAMAAGVCNGTLYDCTLSGNVATNQGGGAWNATLHRCDVRRNEVLSSGSLGGGVYGGAVYGGHILANRSGNAGGGVYGATVVGCTVAENVAGGDYGSGGGAAHAKVYSSVLTGNSAVQYGGGASDCELLNCTLVDNSAQGGGGVYGCSPVNCIVVFNWAASPVYDNFFANDTLLSSCSVPLPPGAGNISVDPQFVDAAASNYDLRTTSPCLDAGILQEWMTPEVEDVAGRPRVMNGRVDMGANEFRYEAQLRALLAGAWVASNQLMRTCSPAARSPYAGDPVTAGAVPSNVVDWVLLTLRASPTSAPLASVSALLMNDGTLRGAGGTTQVFVEARGSLYGVLQHRSHAAVMSAEPVFSNRTVVFDFSASPASLYGGTGSVVSVATNRWALRAGDVDGDGEVGPADLLIWQTQEGK